MKTHKSLLCVGGPLSGQRFDAQSGAGFSVPVMSPEQIALPDKEAEDFRPNAKAAYTNHHYRAETFHTPQGDVEFWAPHDQTPLQSITILLEALAERARPEEAKKGGGK